MVHLGNTNHNSNNTNNNEEEASEHVEHQLHFEDDLKTSLAGVAGNILEWYDFAIFGYFSDIIADNFFAPSQEGNASLLETFAVSGLAFLARPLGGAVIGRMGDIHGRKGALETSIFLMAASTFSLGCLPTYSKVGRLSTLLLILMRLFQGLSVGGQFMSSLVFTLERKPAGTWGFWGSVVSAALSVGVTLGSLAATVLRESLTEEQLETWGWRIPFWFGAIGAIPALYLKLQVKEHNIRQYNLEATADSPENLNSKETEGEIASLGEKSESNNKITDPIRKALGKSNRRAFFAGLLIPTLGAAGFYIIFIWLAIFMDSLLVPPIPHAFAMTSINSFLGGIIFTLIAGKFVDWIGDYAMVMIVSGVLLAVSFPVSLHFIGTGFGSNNEYVGVVAFLIQLYLGILIAFWNGGMTPWMVLIFPPEIRLTSIAIGYNIAVAIWGGFTPLFATLLADQLNDTAVGYLLTATALLSLAALWIAPKKGRNCSHHVNIGNGRDGYEPLLP